MRRVRIKDVARLAGLPYQPVARIFRGHRRASPEEIDRLLLAILTTSR
jgi:hypothetical protein